MTASGFASRSGLFRGVCSGALLALWVVLPCGSAAASDPTLREAAIRRVVEQRAGRVSPQAEATASLHRSLEISWGLVERAEVELRGGARPGESEAIRALLLEGRELRQAYATVADMLSRGPIRASGGEAARSGRRPSLESVRNLLDLLDKLAASAEGDSRLSTWSILRKIEREAERALDVVRRSEPRPSRVVRPQVTEIRQKPIPLGSVRDAPIGEVIETQVTQLAGVESTPEITALAEELGFDPLAIYQHVRNNFRFETYFGCLKGAQATLESGGGNDYDLAALSASLLQASGFSTRFGRGTAIIPAEDIVAWLGLADAAAANVILNTPGIMAVPVVNGPDIIHYRVDRLWVEVEAPVGRFGGELAWFPLDTAFKRHDLSPGVPGLLATVPFDEATYLSDTRTELAWEFYRQQLRDYLEANLPGTALGEVPLGMLPIDEQVGRLPTSLPYQLASLDAIYSAIPASLTHKATVRVRHLGATILSHQVVIPDMALQRFTLSYAVDPADQAIVDGFGGLANTPPGAADVIPELKLDGVVVASGSARPYLDSATLEVDFFKPEGDLFDGTSDHSIRLGEWAGIGIDAYQISETHLQRQAQTVVDAIALEDGGGTADPDELIGAFLYLAIMQYHADVEVGDRSLADLAQYRRVKFVSQGIASGNQEIFSIGGTNFTTVPGALVVDVPRLNSSNFALDNDNTLQTTLRRTIGLNGSAQEHSLWEGFLNLPGISTIKSLQLANVAGIPVFVIDDTDGNASNDCSVLCPQLTLAASTEAAIAADVASGSVVTVPRDPTPLNDWSGVGYITANAGTGSTGYIISGGLNSSSGGFLPDDDLLSGGAVTVVIIDGQTYVIPIGELGLAPGQTLTGDPVNIANGNFYREEVDFMIPALSEPMAFDRYYNSQSTFDGPLGLGWTHGYSDLVSEQPDLSVIWIDNHGSAFTFQPDVSPGTYISPPGLRESLTSDAGGFTLRRFDGRIQQFDTGGRLVSRADRNGNAFTFGYDGSNRLVTVSDPASRSLTLAYNAADKIDTVTDFTSRIWTYSYDADDRLQQVTSPSDVQTLAMITQYDYDAAGRLVSIIQPNGGTRTIRYYSNGRTAQVIDPLGHAMTLEYNPFKSETRVTDERGFTEIHTFNGSGNLVSLVHPDGSRESWTYIDNRVTSHTDQLGETWTYEYDPDGNLERSVDPTGLETLTEYDLTYGNVTKLTRPGPRVFDYVYDLSGNLEETHDPEGNTELRTNNAQGLADTITSFRGPVRTLTYNVDGQIATRTTPLPSVETTNYDPRGTRASFVDGNGHSTTYTYDLLDRLISVLDAEGNLAEYTYDAAGRLVTTQDPEGGLETYSYDLNDRVVGELYADGASISIRYDEAGNILESTDEIGRRTRFTYDARGRAIQVEHPDGGKERTLFDAAGRVVKTVDQRGNVATSVRDGAGRLLRTLDEKGDLTVWTYDENVNVATLTDRRGAVTTFEYDGLNRLTETRGEEGRVETIDYDANGNITAQVGYDVQGLGSIPDDPRTLPLSRQRATTMTYDAYDRLESKTDPDGGLTVFTRDDVGNVTMVEDPRNNITQYVYDKINRVTNVIRPDTGESVLNYDGNSNRTRMTTPRGGIYEWSFDSRSRNTSITDPNGRSTQFEFDPAGQRLRQVNSDGTWLNQSYDPVGRPRYLERSNGTFVDRVYDRAGNLVRATTENTELSFVYDQINRRVQETLSLTGASFSATVLYDYDEEGNLVGVTDAGGRELTYGYDLAGNLQTLSDDAGGPSATFTMNGYGERGVITYGNGTVGNHGFDKSGRVASIDWTGSIAQFVYGRDAAGNPETITESVGGVAETLTAVYDMLNRPTNVSASVNPGLRGETFNYDMNGNHSLDRGGSFVTYDSAEQPLTGGTTQFQHDARGNRMSAVDGGGNGIETIYDPSNRLIRTRTLVSGSAIEEIEYTYDALDRLVEINDGITARRVVYTQRNPLNEFDGTGALQTSYTMGAELDDVLGAIVGGAVRYAHLDAVGSLRALTNSAGAVVATRTYGQFGNIVSETGTFDVQLGFTGRLIVPSTGFVNLRARWYDPNLGAFLGKDPLPFPLSGDSPNPYNYAANRPGLMIDPLGLTPDALWPDLFGAAGATQLVLRENLTFWDPISRQFSNLRWNNLPGERLTPGNLFAIQRDGRWLRLDYGAHGNLSSAQWHWNGKGVHSRFGVANHQPALGFAGRGRVGSMLNTIGNARGARAAVGRGLVVVGAGMDIYTVATSDTPVQTGAEKVGAWAGAYGGGKLLGAGGAALGSFGGPVGTAIGGVGGAIVGGVVGYFGGEKAVQTVWGWFD